MEKSKASFVNMTAGVIEPPKMPSADLINYRFDLTDKKFDDLGKKLDHLTNNFVTKEEILTMRDERDEKLAALQLQIDTDRAQRRWWTRTITTLVIGALLTSIGSIVVYLLLGHNP